MAVGAWQLYNQFREFMADGTIDLDTTTFNMHLLTSASNAGTGTLSTLSQLTNELASARGYTLSGKALAGVSWANGASAAIKRFDATANVWTASGGNLGTAAALKFAVIVANTGASAKDGANKLVARSQLSTSGFAVTDGNTLTVTPSANGIFELSGGG